MNIVGISGSLRKGSYNAALLRAMQELAPTDMQIETLDIGNLPLYNTDLEASFPAEAQALKTKVEAADGVIIVTPEFNRMIPGALSNAIDWLSRPYGKNSLAGKPTLVGGVSVGKIGTAIAQSQLKHTLLYLDAHVVGQPELYIGPATDVFEMSENPAVAMREAPGPIKNEQTKELITKALAALASRVQ